MVLFLRGKTKPKLLLKIYVDKTQVYAIVFLHSTLCNEEIQPVSLFKLKFQSVLSSCYTLVTIFLLLVPRVVHGCLYSFPHSVWSVIFLQTIIMPDCLNCFQRERRWNILYVFIQHKVYFHWLKEIFTSIYLTR